MTKPYQKAAEWLGASGCYFLSLCYLAEKVSGKQMNPIVAYFNMLEKKHMTEDCYLSYPDKIFSELSGKKCSISKAGASFLPASNQLEILRFERKTTMTTYAHFVVGNGRGEVEYDPLGSSPTVKEGTLASKRIITLL